MESKLVLVLSDLVITELSVSFGVVIEEVCIVFRGGNSFSNDLLNSVNESSTIMVSQFSDIREGGSTYDLICGLIFYLFQWPY